MQFTSSKYAVLLAFLLPLSLSAQVPANDNCSGTQSLPAFPRVFNCDNVADRGASFNVQDTLTTVNATASALFPRCNPTTSPHLNAPDTWYSFVAAGNVNDFTFTADSTVSSINIPFYTGPNCNNLTRIACENVTSNVMNVSLDVPPGTLVYFTVSVNNAAGTNEGRIAVDLTSTNDCVPENDICDGVEELPPFARTLDCANANDIGATFRVSQTLSTLYAIPSSPFQTCNSGTSTHVAAADVWYSFVTAGNTNDLVFTGGLDVTSINVPFFTGPDCSNLTQIACASANGSTLNTRLELAAGTRVYFSLSINTSGGENEGLVTLDLTTINECPPLNDVCAGTDELPAFTRIFDCDAGDSGRSETVSARLSTRNASPSAPFAVCDPTSSTHVPAPDVWYRFISAGTSNELVFTGGPDVTSFNILIYTGTDCGDIQFRKCDFSNSNTLTTEVDVPPGTEVFFRVSINTISGENEGEFDLNLTSTAVCPTCIGPADGIISITPTNLSGTYSCGQRVEICFDLLRYVGNAGGSVEWLHSVVPTFGDGWDVNSITVSPSQLPPSCDGTGTWGWYPMGWTGCQSGTVFPYGFAYESNLGVDNSCPAGPGNNYGDGSGTNAAGQNCRDRDFTTTFCLNISVKDCPPGANTFDGQPLDVAFTPLSDSEAGSWTRFACASQTYALNATVLVCFDEDPISFPTDVFCNAVPDGTIAITPDNGNTVDPFNRYVRNAAGDLVYSCLSCVGTQTAMGLDEGEYFIEVENADNGCQRFDTVQIGPGFDFTADFTFDNVCRSVGGIPLNGQMTAPVPPGSQVSYVFISPTGDSLRVVANSSNTTGGITTLVAPNPTEEGNWEMIGFVNDCPAPTNTQLVSYRPSPSLFIRDSTLCPGDEVVMQVNGGSGPYFWYRDDQTAPIAQGNSPTFRENIPDPGPDGRITYRVLILGGQCPDELFVDVIVDTPPAVSYAFTPSDSICPGDPISIQVIQANGIPFPAGFGFRWNNGQTTDTYTDAGTMTSGSRTARVEITSPGGCSESYDTTWFVTPALSVDIDEPNPVVCGDGSATVTATPSGGVPPYTYAWGPGSFASTPSIDLGRDSAVITGITLTVTDALGCTVVSPEVNLNVAPPLSAPTFVACDPMEVTSVEFFWNDVGQDAFEVYYTVAGQPEQTVDLNYTSTSYNVTGLGPASTVTIRVVPIQNVGGTRCEGAAGTQTCQSLNCQSPGWSYTPDAPVCVATAGQPYDLTIATAISGDLYLSSFDLSLDSFPVDPTGTTTIMLPALPPGVLQDTFFVLGEHAAFDGACTADTLVPIFVGAFPDTFFTVVDPTICVNGTATFEYPGSTADITLSWDFPTGATPATATGPGPHGVTFDQIGDFPVTLSIDGPVCPTITGTELIQVIDTLRPPTIVCAEVDFDAVTFAWSNPSSNDFIVNILDVPPGATTDQRNDSLFVTGLAENESVTIEVAAVGSSSCGNSSFATHTCTSRQCPPIALAIVPVGPVCTGDATPIPLDAGISGSDGTAVTTWTLNGNVITSSFSADTLAPATYELIASVFEGDCTFEDTTTVVVNALPIAFYTIDDDTTCVNGARTLTAGVPQTGFTYDWDYAGTDATAMLIDPATIRYSWSTPGLKPVSLVVTDTNGCVSVPFVDTVLVIAPIPAPTITCGPAGVRSVNFQWDAVAGPGGLYLVSLNGGPPMIQDSTSLMLRMLIPDEVVDIEVVGIGNSRCGNSTPGTGSCTAALCPTFVADYSGLVDSICLENGNETIDLSVITVQGGSGVMSSYTFSGPGVTGTTFDAAAAGGNEAGRTHVLTIDYEEEGPCTFTEDFEIVVFERPSVFILPAPDACIDAPVSVRVGSTNFVPNDDVTIDFDGGTVLDDGNPDDSNYLVSWATPGDKTVTASVISNISGCPSLPTTQTFTIADTLVPPVVSCGATTLTSVTFDWAQSAGAVGYEVTAMGVTTSLSATETSFTINDLLPEQTATITVVARGDGPCGDSSPSIAQTCQADPCPPGAIRSDTPSQLICLDGSEAPIDLNASLDVGAPNGSITWSGTGVANTGSGFAFDPTGLAAGDYELTVSYDGPSICDSEDRITITLQSPPVVGIDPADTQVCVGATFAVGLDGAPIAGVTYAWDFDGAAVTDLGNERYEVVWATPGDRTVRVTATNECFSEAAVVVTVTPTLDAPQPTCARQDLDGVLFTWPAVPAASEGYQVSVNGGAFGPIQVETEFFVGGLDFGETVDIRVRSVRSGTTCDLSAVADASCAARVCPPITIAPASAQNEFCADATNTTVLQANLTGDDGMGEITWDGPGVSQNLAGEWIFDPQVAGIGVHTLTVTYVQELLCVYTSTMTITVFPLPDSSFDVSEAVVCTNTEITVRPGESLDAGATYAWDFASALVTDAGNETYRLAWPEPGTYTVVLTVTKDGCATTSAREVIVELPPTAGRALDDVFEQCVGDTTPVELGNRIVGEDGGGTWTIVQGAANAGQFDGVNGMLNPNGLPAGDYQFEYSVGGGVCPVDSARADVRLLELPVANAGEDQTLTCTMGMVSLDGTDSEQGEGYAYRWTSDNPDAVIMDADMQMIDVGQTGTYTFSVTDDSGCSATDEVNVDSDREAPIMDINVSNVTCFAADDGVIQVSEVMGGRPPYRYTLNGENQGGQTLFTRLSARSYELTVTDANGCFSTLVLDLTEPDALSVELNFPGGVTEVRAGTVLNITASVSGGNVIDTLIWQPDSLKGGGVGLDGIEIVANETQTISVMVIDELGCMATDRQQLLVRKERPVYFPTAFSPNGDNNNDIYFINGDLSQVVAIEDFVIYDRWGEAVYTSPQVENPDGSGGGRFLPNDPRFGWDGRLNGKFLNPQVLVYSAKVTFSDGEVIIYKGDFVLVR